MQSKEKMRKGPTSNPAYLRKCEVVSQKLQIRVLARKPNLSVHSVLIAQKLRYYISFHFILIDSLVINAVLAGPVVAELVLVPRDRLINIFFFFFDSSWIKLANK